MEQLALAAIDVGRYDVADVRVIFFCSSFRVLIDERITGVYKATGREVSCFATSRLLARDIPRGYPVTSACVEVLWQAPGN